MGRKRGGVSLGLVLGLAGLGAAGLGLALVVGRRRALPPSPAGAGLTAPELPLVAEGPAAEPMTPAAGVSAAPLGDMSEDDETALARMLGSETSSRELRIVVGWLTLQRALRSGRSLFDFLTRGKGYGPFYVSAVVDGKKKRKATGRHASTAEPPTAQTRQLARAILEGRALPSSEILSHVPGSWVERGIKGAISDEGIIAKQSEYKEGIYGQIAGSDWVLFSRDAPFISVAPFNTATDRLNALKKIPAVSEIVS